MEPVWGALCSHPARNIMTYGLHFIDKLAQSATGTVWRTDAEVEDGQAVAEGPQVRGRTLSAIHCVSKRYCSAMKTSITSACCFLAASNALGSLHPHPSCFTKGPLEKELSGEHQRHRQVAQMMCLPSVCQSIKQAAIYELGTNGGWLHEGGRKQYDKDSIGQRETWQAQGGYEICDSRIINGAGKTWSVGP